MDFFSQNKKIAGTALALFAISFSSMVFFLGDLDTGKVDVMHAADSAVTNHSEELPLDGEGAAYREIMGDEKMPFIVVNGDGVIQYVDEDFAHLIGKRESTLVDENFFEMINSEDLAEFVAVHSKVLNKGENVEGVGPFRLINRDREVFVMVSAYPILDDDKRVLEIILGTKDITDKLKEITDIEEIKTISFK